MKRTRTFAVALAAVGLIAATAGTASAETLTHSRSGTAVIAPSTAGVPAGAKVTKRRVTVKKGKKTVAKQKRTYKAKPGTYTATSTISYKARKAHTIKSADVFAECRVSSMTVVSDRTEFTADADDYVWYDSDGDGYEDSYYQQPVSSGYISGQVTIRYTGACENVDGKRFAGTWDYDDYIFADVDSSGDTTDAILGDATYGVGDVDYVFGGDLVKPATYYSGYGKTQTLKKSRTVVVR